MHIHFQIQFERKLLKIFGPDMAHFLKNIGQIIMGIGFKQKNFKRYVTNSKKLRKQVESESKIGSHFSLFSKFFQICELPVENFCIKL